MPSKRANVYFFLWNNLPKVVLFHSLTYFVKESIVYNKLDGRCQLWKKIWINSGWEVQIVLNRKGLLVGVCWEWKDRSKGLWWGCVLGKWRTDASGNKFSQSYVASIPSSLSNTLQQYWRLFVQVYLQPIKPRSTKWQ